METVKLCKQHTWLNERQRRLCLLHPDLIPSVLGGAMSAIKECKKQFRMERWNCPANNITAVFGPVLGKGSRESAFVHSILAAGMVHAVTRSCSRGDLLTCGCDNRHRGPRNHDYDITPNETWKWGGCSEDIMYGVKFSRSFLNPGEDNRNARSAMNRHNNEAGRQAVIGSVDLACKCHGISGTCEFKTCWWQQASFRKLGDNLKVRYDSAKEMVVITQATTRGNEYSLKPKYKMFKKPTKGDLIYYEQSPSYCDYDPENGSFGTTGRVCNASSHAIDGCGLMCCQRGYRTQRVERIERCDCQFVWCCEVVCKQCKRPKKRKKQNTVVNE
uniref:Protein Wnt n=1 Tax=Himerometra robustipinna TaxID=706653 RepID=A0A5B8GWB1_9ECHI|nr:Wnt3 [Himerometra robustipinna]